MRSYGKIRYYKSITDSSFRRLTGVKRTAFETLLSVLTFEIKQNKRIKGHPSVLTVADQLLIMLEYSKEYRIYFHISQSYQVSKPKEFHLISWAKNLLIKS